MTLGNLENWSTEFRHDGLLYFTQRINEMLFFYTDHIYKAPVLNTQLLVEEYLSTAKLVEAGTIKEMHLSQIMEEFQESFNNDIVLKSHINDKDRKQILHKLNSATTKNRRKMMEYLKYLLSDYNLWCKQYLEEIVPKEKEKKKIERAIRCYIPGLISSGYSQEYIYNYNKTVFNIRPVESMDALHIFLDRFDFVKRAYDVYIAIDIEAISFKDILIRRFDVSFGPFEDIIDLKYDNKKYQLIRIKMLALDEQAAAWDAYSVLNIFFEYYRYFAEKREKWFFYNAKVVDQDSNGSFVKLKWSSKNYSKVRNWDKLPQFSEFIISKLQKNAIESYIHINKALNAHNTAIDASDINNRFLNLWSTLEILFVSEYDNSKLAEITKKMVWILLKDYYSYLFNYIKENLHEILNEEEISSIVNQIDEDDREYWEFYVVALNKYSVPRKDLFQLLNEYPLIRSRISQLNELCCNASLFLHTVETFKKRIIWHLTRLYRTRNTIIHSGIKPDNLRELVEHLHSYSDECLTEIIIRLIDKPKLESISNVLLYVQMQTEKGLSLLQEKKELSRSDIDFLLNIKI